MAKAFLRRNINGLLILGSLAVHLVLIACLQLNVSAHDVPRSNLLLMLVDKPITAAIIPAAVNIPEKQPTAQPAKPKPTRGLQTTSAQPELIAPAVEQPILAVTASSNQPVALPEPQADKPRSLESTAEVTAKPASPVKAEPQVILKALPLPLPESVPTPAPAVDIAALLRDYAGGVKRSILSRKEYPTSAERLGQQGTVQVGFSISADGSLDGLSLKSSSGYETLDEAALDAVSRAAPFKPIPLSAKRESLSMSISLKFYLE